MCHKGYQQNIAIYAAHTNLDNILNGVNGKIAEKLEFEKYSNPSAHIGLLLIKCFYLLVHSAENASPQCFVEAGGEYLEITMNAVTMQKDLELFDK